MKVRNMVLTLGFFAASIGIAQGPLYDRITVNLPYPINVNGTTLQAGDYEIRQHESVAGGSRVVHFFRDGGMKLETTAMAIPALDNRTPEQTRLVLDHVGPDYYLNKIWVQGKDYGYEFPIPENIRNREIERNSPASVTARYEAAPTTTATAEALTTTTTTQTAQATPPPAPVETPAPAPVTETQPAPAPVAEAQPAPAPTPAPVEMAQNTPPASPAPMVSADRPARTMPSTAANWLNLLLGGGLLSSSGLALRRFRG